MAAAEEVKDVRDALRHGPDDLHLSGSDAGRAAPDSALKHAEQRWGPYSPSPEQFAGHTLLHTDLAPHNVLITDRAHLIDWAWPTRGAAWIDPAVLILRLMEAGHTATTADEWARANLPAWTAAHPAPVTAFSAANAALWDEIAHSDGQVWKKNMARHAHDWLTYWRSTA
jgi:Ser/Thr protein kinase RdoA (MazF antagonist)